MQYRATLDTNSSWVTLTNSLPAETGTNTTTFVHYNQVDCPTGQIFGMMFSGQGTEDSSWSSSESKQEDFKPTWPTVIPKDGSRAPVPLAIYPPGLDLPDYIIIWPDGSADEWSKELVEKYREIERAGGDGPEPEDAGGDLPNCGFYRVVRNGASIWAITNGTILSGVVTLPVEVGNDGGTLETVTLQANDTSIPGVEPLEPPFSMLSFELDTTRLSNGDNYLVVEAIWNMNTNADLEADDWPDFVKLQSYPVQVVVSNEIFFPTWIDEFGGDLISFDAVSIYPDADWQIDIYDSQTNYVGSFTNHTTDGSIHVDWGVTNSQGTLLSDNVFYSATTVTYATGGGTASVRKPNPRKIRVVDNYPSVGQWIVAWQYIFENNPETYKNQSWPQPNMLNSIFAAYTAAQNGGGLIAPLGSLPGSFQPLRFGTNYTTTQKTQDWTQFKIALTNLNARNLYYFGHGAPEKLGGTKDPNRNLTSKEVGTLLRYNDSNPTNRHFFRYVFLDGCNTANGSFPTKFGIPKKEHVPYSDYLAPNIRPRAFSGWTDYKAFAILGFIPWQFPGYRINFWSYWFQNNRELWQAHRDAKDSVFPNSMSIGQSLKIYGYENMRFYDFNTQ